SVFESLTKGFVERPKDEVVGDGRPDLLCSLPKIAWAAIRQRAFQVSDYVCGPLGRHFRVKKLGRPTTEVQRPTTKTVGESGETPGDIGPPWEAPHLLPSDAWIDIRRTRNVQAHHREVLDVLRDKHPSGLEHEHAPMFRWIAI